MANDPEDDDENLRETPDGTALTGSINPELYYMLEAQTADWQWLLSSALITRNLNNTKFAFIRFEHPNAHPMFFIAKDKITPEELAKILGYKGEPAALSKTDIIHLKPIGDQSKWQKPTVPYAGAA